MWGLSGSLVLIFPSHFHRSFLSILISLQSNKVLFQYSAESFPEKNEVFFQAECYWNYWTHTHTFTAPLLTFCLQIEQKEHFLYIAVKKWYLMFAYIEAFHRHYPCPFLQFLEFCFTITRNGFHTGSTFFPLLCQLNSQHSPIALCCSSASCR